MNLTKKQKMHVPPTVKNTWAKIRSGLEQFGRAMILPVSIIPVLAIIGALGYILQTVGNKTGWMKIDAYKAAADAVKVIGMAPIYNLDILFAIGLAAGLAKEEKVSAALAGGVALIGLYFAGYIILKYTSILSTFTAEVDQNIRSTLKPANGETYTDKELAKIKDLVNAVVKSLTIERFGKYSKSFNLNALGGILAGLTGFIVHKYTYRLQFPKAIAFFGGPKFSPVASLLVAFILGIPLTLVWVHVQKAMDSIGYGIRSMKAGGSFLYGFTNRLLLPFGLHNVPNAILRYTPAGGTWTAPDNSVVTGFYSILQAKLSHGVEITANDSMISNGTYPTNMFALPGAAVAMFLAVPKEKRKIAAPIIFGALSSSVLSGVTEPIEFTFIFTAPILWIVHAFLTGFTYMFMYLAGAGMVSGTGEGIITWLIFNAPAYEIVSRVWMMWVLGPIFFLEYLVVFYFLITKLNLKTPGRDDQEFRLFSKKDFRNKNKTDQTNTDPDLAGEKAEDVEMAKQLIELYGGFENMNEIGACISRLRISVKDKDKVQRDQIKGLGAMGVVDSGEQVQSVFGAKAMVYARIMNILRRKG
ncbi:PTS transporter subunit EIIC [Mycoplasmopsis pullorum]|uniref:Uncharacterized protein n=1 Tax=Mycoplasmopsis pullorum TaxID=48003 RepID=A0A1L4FRZ9_9BACT|nr:PTS transporter subunit EIIC [Mycoplasmopsis pullorum]APJ38381.1 hypothetical protein BLA55_01685 [Mycoplasmopsis pullorum]